MRTLRSGLSGALVLWALAASGCGDGGEEPGAKPSADAPRSAGVEEYDLALPDDGVEGDVPPGVGEGG